MSNEAFIKELCDNWRKEACTDGEIHIGSKSERFRLLNNGIKFHELDFHELISAGVGLAKNLLLKGLNTIIVPDYFHFWSWSAEIILDPHDSFFIKDESDLRDLFQILVRSGLSNPIPPTNNYAFHSLLKRVSDLTEFNSKQLLQNCHKIMVYLGFPLLEGICKKMCLEYIDYDGTVKKDFKVPINNPIRSYQAGEKCSNLGHLLYLLQSIVATKELSEVLTELYKHIEQFGDGKPGYQVIFNWRCASLHGEATYPTIGGTLLSLTILICLHQTSDKYDIKKTTILERIKRDYNYSLSTGNRSPFEFYPPYLLT